MTDLPEHDSEHEHDRVHAFADGELSPEEAAAFRVHLGTCARCQAELGDVLQLQALGEQLGEDQSPERPAANPASPPRAFQPVWHRRRRLFQLAAAGSTLVLVFVFWAVGRGGGVRRGAMELALADTRGLEARLAYPGASAYRPYNVSRSGEGQPAAPVPLRTLVELEERQDFHGLAAGHLLRGERDQAAESLERAGDSPDVASDRAVLALMRGEMDEALALLDEVLARQPRHPQALWNRGLVLRELGLGLLAAGAFGEVASLLEPGWSEEARQRAEALRRELDASRRSWEEVTAAGKALSMHGTPMPPGLARQARGAARGYFYLGVMGAPTAEDARALLPLARELDTLYGGDRLERYVLGVAGRDFRRRDPLARQLRQIVARTFDAAGASAYVEAVRAAGETDLLLAALPLLQLLPARLPEYRAAAEALGDPWFLLNAELEQARADHGRSELAKVESRLLASLPVCRRERADYRCAQIEALLADIYTVEHRLVEAREHAMAGLAVAREMNDWSFQSAFLQRLGDIARFRNGFALTRAYLREEALRFPNSCPVQRYLHESLATLHLFALRPKEARVELEEATRCGEPLSLVGAFALADLIRLDPRPEDASRLEQALRGLRASGKLRPGQLAMADHIEGLALLERDRAAGRALLRKAIAAAGQLPREDLTGQKARAYGFSALILDAGRAGAWPEALDLFAEEVSAPSPRRCALGIELHDEQLLVVARGADGQVMGRYDRGRTSPEFDVTTLVPRDVRDALAPCERVEVLARYPVHGLAGLLPPALAWSYHSGRGRPAARPAASRPLVVHDVEAPASLHLPRLGTWGRPPPSSQRVELSGASATPSRVLAEMVDATEVELHAHGLVNLGVSDASFIALSPEPDGRYALTAGEVRRQALRAAPVVLLAACRAARTAPFMHEPWSLPVAFLDAGARAVIASPQDIPDAEAGPFFEGVLSRIRAGQPAAVAVRDERTRYLERDPGSWTGTVVVFE